MSKPVNKNIRSFSGKIGETSSGRLELSGKRPKPEKVPCLTLDVPRTETNSEDLIEEIPGVDQLDEVIPGSKVVVDGFYSDEASLLIKRATRVSDRRAVFIAPRVGWPKGIYRKPSA